MLKFRPLLTNALAIIGACHLLAIKRFHAKFLRFAIARRHDQHLRAPTIPEVVDAETAAWQSVAELMAEGQWALNASLSEVANCSQVFHTAPANDRRTHQSWHPRLKPTWTTKVTGMVLLLRPRRFTKIGGIKLWKVKGPGSVSTRVAANQSKPWRYPH